MLVNLRRRPRDKQDLYRLPRLRQHRQKLRLNPWLLLRPQRHQELRPCLSHRLRHLCRLRRRLNQLLRQLRHRDQWRRPHHRRQLRREWQHPHHRQLRRDMRLLYRHINRPRRVPYLVADYLAAVAGNLN